jgi:outer membrane protein
MKPLFLSVLIFFIGLASTANATMNLQQSYEAAVKRSEDLASQQELVAQAEERYSQAVGSVLPNVAFVGTYLKQDNSAQQTAGGTNLSPPDQQTYKLTATQPLFRGFREYAALKQTKILTEGQGYLRDQAYLQLFQDTAQAFYQVIANEKDLFNLQNERDVNDKRLKEVGQFRKLGRSRDSDVLSVQSNIATLDYSIETMKTAIVTSRAVWSFLTGEDKNTPLVDQEVFPASVEPVSFYLNKVEDRPDVKAAKDFVDAGERGVSIARGGHLPSIDLNGNYYFERPGYLSNVKWDVSLGLTFPIFQGGVINSEVRLAASRLKAQELALSKARRSAQQQIDSFHAQVIGDLAQIEKQKAAIDIYQKTYQAEMKDYRYGLVTNLDVLVALNTSEESARSLDRLIYQFRLDYLKLQAQVAQRPTMTAINEAHPKP